MTPGFSDDRPRWTPARVAPARIVCSRAGARVLADSRRLWTDEGARNDSRPMPLVATRLFIRPIFSSPLVAALLLGLVAATRTLAASQDWSVEITPDGELFPVLDLSQMAPKTAGASGGGNGLVDVRVAGDDVPRHLRLEVDTPGLRTPAIVEADVARGAPIELRPRLDWDTTYLRAMTAPRAQMLHVTLERSGLAKLTRDVPVRVHPLDDALYYVREGKERVDLGWVFAAYVDPRDPVVDEIVAAARTVDAHFESASVGAQARISQALAIWTALMRHGLRYAPGDPALSRGPTVYSQRVRLLADVWRERRANCVDGSVLIASVLERIGIPAFIVLVPGHAFVGFHADRDDNARVEFLETTLLGDGAGHADAVSAGAPDDRTAAARFDAARNAGRARWKRVAARFERRHGPDYALIDIGTARSYGIIPLRAHGDERLGGERTVPTAADLSRKNHPP